MVIHCQLQTGTCKLVAKPRKFLGKLVRKLLREFPAKFVGTFLTKYPGTLIQECIGPRPHLHLRLCLNQYLDLDLYLNLALFPAKFTAPFVWKVNDEFISTSLARSLSRSRQKLACRPAAGLPRGHGRVEDADWR